MITTVAFVGNPNVGKSSWINALSNSKFKVGNYHGVTVEKKEADVEWFHTKLRLIDLPGTYGLSQASNEEEITTSYLLHGKVDVIVNVVDATNLRRNLTLTLLCRELQIPMLVLLNYKDEVEKQGIYIQIGKLQHRLQLKMILCSSFDVSEQEEIKRSIVELAQENRTAYRHHFLLSKKNEELLHRTTAFISSLQVSYQTYTEAQIALYALKWLEQDCFYVAQLQEKGLNLSQGYELLDEVAKGDFLEHRSLLVQQCMRYVQSYHHQRLTLTRKLDQSILHPVASIPLFFLFMFLLFGIVFIMSQPLTNWLDQFINTYVTYYIMKLFSFLPPFWLMFLEKSVFRGVGGVLIFLPMLACLFYMLAFLEECGYFSRIAFMFDRVMRPFGMSGKSFVAMLIGLGCTVPAIYATKTIHDDKGKRITALMVPFISCGARLPVYLLFAAAFFPDKTVIVLFSLYGIGIVVAFMVAAVCNRYLPKKKSAFFMIELPPYRLPSQQYIVKKVFLELRAFVKKTVGVVAVAMMVLFLLSYFPHGRMEDSYVTRLAKWCTPMFEPLGFGTRYETIAALPGALLAKENVVGYLSLVLVKEQEESFHFRSMMYDTKQQFNLLLNAVQQTITFQRTKEAKTPFIHGIQQLWSDPLKELRAFSYLVYLSIMMPCVMTQYAIYKEYSLATLLLSLCLSGALPYLVSLMIFQVGRFFLS